MKKQNGFTLIELVIVIIVLGILAATAVPKFINLQDDAKLSARSGAEAAIRSAADIVYSQSAILGEETQPAQDFTDNGTTIDTEFGYPAATLSGIARAVELTGFTVAVSNPTTTTASVFLVGEDDTAAGDLCLRYTEAANATTRYVIEEGTINANLTSCTPI